jgi:hypothetical protein
MLGRGTVRNGHVVLAELVGSSFDVDHEESTTMSRFELGTELLVEQLSPQGNFLGR